MSKVIQYSEGQRVRPNGNNTYLPDLKGSHIATFLFSTPHNPGVQFVPVKAFELHQEYVRRLEAEKQQYLKRIAVIRQWMDTELDKLNSEDLI